MNLAPVHITLRLGRPSARANVALAAAGVFFKTRIVSDSAADSKRTLRRLHAAPVSSD